MERYLPFDNMNNPITHQGIGSLDYCIELLENRNILGLFIVFARIVVA